jgi:hypothetical protein
MGASNLAVSCDMTAEKAGIVECAHAAIARQRTVNTFRGNRYARNTSTTVGKDVFYVIVSEHGS